jgi:hypothetical protein
MSRELPEGRFLTAFQAVEFLSNELGIPTSRSSFSKETMPSRATGPVPVAYWGKRPLWTPSSLRSWAAARLRLIQSGSNIAPEDRLKAAETLERPRSSHEPPRGSGSPESNI